jgi:hypothetical protein
VGTTTKATPTLATLAHEKAGDGVQAASQDVSLSRSLR